MKLTAVLLATLMSAFVSATPSPSPSPPALGDPSVGTSITDKAVLLKCYELIDNSGSTQTIAALYKQLPAANISDASKANMVDMTNKGHPRNQQYLYQLAQNYLMWPQPDMPPIYRVYWVPDQAVFPYFSRFLGTPANVQSAVADWLSKFRPDTPKPVVYTEFYFNAEQFWGALVEYNWLLKFVSFDKHANLSPLLALRSKSVGTNDVRVNKVVQWLDSLRPSQ